MNVGIDGHKDNSKIEGSFTGIMPHVDVSYVDGYSVPIVCSCGGRPVTGCNLELFELSTCPSLQGNTCINMVSRYSDMGPASPFFKFCEGAAYTFPKDDRSDLGCRQNRVIDCCVGTSCPAVPRQPYHRNY